MHLCTSVCNILNMTTSYRTVEKFGNYSNLPSYFHNAYGSQLPVTHQRY